MSHVNNFQFVQLEQGLKPKDYKSTIKPIWCPGCGDYGVLNAIHRALAELKVDPQYLVNISGIGCSSRMPYFMQAYKMHTLHGRAAAVATGTQLARPDLLTLVTGGDGDGFSIGGGHMPHVARKNVNLTYVLMDNQIYGLTKGQVSPTSRKEMKAYTTPYGGVEEPLDPIIYMLSYGATYVAQGFAGNPKQCAELIKGGLAHKGFAFINVLSQCPTFNKIDTVKYLREIAKDLPEQHDTSDISAALQIVSQYHQQGKSAIGLLYQINRPSLDENMSRLINKVKGHKDYDINQIIDLQKP